VFVGKNPNIRSFIGWVLVAGTLLVTAPTARAQGTRADYERAAAFRARTSGRVFRQEVRPRWLDGGRHFWYRVDTGPRSHEFVLVDVGQGRRLPAFNHPQLAEALQRQGVAEVGPERLPLEDLQWDIEQDAVRFRIAGRTFCFHRGEGRLDEVPVPAEAKPLLAEAPVPQRSRSTGDETRIRFENTTAETVEIFWLDTEGRRRSYGRVPAGQTREQHTFEGHAWWVLDARGELSAAAVAHPDLPDIRIDQQQRVFVVDTVPAATEAEPAGRGRRVGRSLDGRSPDGRWQAFYRDHNVWIRSMDNGEEFPLSSDGTADDAYRGRFHWSPDSSRLVVLRTQAGDERKVYYIESSPRDQLQPKLHSYDYLKPGDRVPVDRPKLFDIQARQPVPVSEGLFENPWSIGDLRWAADASHFTFLVNQRGHQVLRIVAVDARTGEARAIVEERSETFIDYSGKLFVHYLDAAGEILWMSERDGWNHLYLIDAASGEVKHQITQGPWVVRNVEHVDEQNRQIWFAAGGIWPEQDPYFLHYARVDFDGSNLVRLTENDGTHSVRFSPDRRSLIATWSRVDSPPVTELRCAESGRLLCVLEQADWSRLLESGWQIPEPFVANGRDGQTDIYGVIFRPTNFDPDGKYPVIEDIYAGPHSAFVPKRFAAFHRQQALAELGVIVVKIDGMGTSHRSKAFHDVCWQNLGDAGFPDRILWLQAAAAVNPAMDLSRVGIFGGSAGGQNALRALLAHGDFYHVAVADCGCHDNRMDKIWWNEQWMGWPVGPHYADSSNVTHAHRLTGKLLLIVGETDRNVDPNSTMQVVDALIRADKDFDLLVMPGVGHGAAETPYANRRRQDFFVRHLLGVEPRRD
jgi:dipeptidyl-peptidase 4